MRKKKIALIPIDNRPVCYQLPEQIVSISKDYELLMPERELLGSLTQSADIEKIFSWLEKVIDSDYIILSLDTLAYGGLINSRRIPDSFDEIINRVKRLKDILEKKSSAAKVFAFSSIMRISNNNVNEEEKSYWNVWGTKIFDWSYNYHYTLKNNDHETMKKQNCIASRIPDRILNDYLDTRKRNFEINITYLKLLKEGIFDFVVYSKDDCAEFGLNVIESEQINQLISSENLNAVVKTGADEIPLSLIARAMSDEKVLKICPVYTQPYYNNKISKYEDVSVKNSVMSQIDLSGNQLVSSVKDADLVLLVNNFKNQQGELVMGIYEEGYDKAFYFDENKPIAVADILNANGSDNIFMDNLFKKDWSNLKGYAGWNTTGNTLGSVLCMASAAMQNPDEENLKKALFTRLCDDWAYQANVRSVLKAENSFQPEKKMRSFVFVINKKLNTNYSVSYAFPWNRHFEIEIIF